MVAVYVLGHSQLRMRTSRTPIGVRVTLKVLLGDTQRWQLSVNMQTKREVQVRLAFTVKDLELLCIKQEMRIVVRFNDAVIVPAARRLGRST